MKKYIIINALIIIYFIKNQIIIIWYILNKVHINKVIISLTSVNRKEINGKRKRYETSGCDEIIKMGKSWTFQ